MAIACLRLLTLRPEPLFNVPRFLRLIVDRTLRDAALPYLAMADLQRQKRANGVLGGTKRKAGSWKLEAGS
jgi:hypothetical protein